MWQVHHMCIVYLQCGVRAAGFRRQLRHLGRLGVLETSLLLNVKPKRSCTAHVRCWLLGNSETKNPWWRASSCHGWTDVQQCVHGLFRVTQLKESTLSRKYSRMKVWDTTFNLEKEILLTGLKIVRNFLVYLFCTKTIHAKPKTFETNSRNRTVLDATLYSYIMKLRKLNENCEHISINCRTMALY